jgi:hypothetical protein
VPQLHLLPKLHCYGYRNGDTDRNSNIHSHGDANSNCNANEHADDCNASTRQAIWFPKTFTSAPRLLAGWILVAPRVIYYRRAANRSPICRSATTLKRCPARADLIRRSTTVGSGTWRFQEISAHRDGLSIARSRLGGTRPCHSKVRSAEALISDRSLCCPDTSGS